MGITKGQRNLEYECTGDARILLNSVYTTRKTYIGYGTESKIEFDTIIHNNKYNYIVFTNCEIIPGTKAISGTMLISEVHSNIDISEPNIIPARLPYCNTF